MPSKKFAPLLLLTLALSVVAPGFFAPSDRLTAQTSTAPGSIAQPSIPSPTVLAQAPTEIEQRNARILQAAKLELQGEQQLEDGQYAPAVQNFLRALAIYQKYQDESSILVAEKRLAKAYLLQGQYTLALPLWQRQVAAARKDGYGFGPSLGQLGLTYYLMGNMPAAETALRESIVIWNSIVSREDNSDADKVTLLDQLAHAYRLLQKVLVAQNKPEAALEIAEAGRARALAELVAQRSSGRKVPLPTLSELRQIAQSQNSTLVMYSIVGREMRVLNIEPRDETDLYIWVIQPSGTIAFRRVDLKAANIPSLKNLVLSIRESTIGVRGRGLGVVSTASGRDNLGGGTSSSKSELAHLHRVLIEPIADQLPKDPNALVTLIPESSLLLVPFAALQDSSGKYLIERHTLRMSPSIQVLGLNRPPAAPRSLAASPLIVGNPTMPRLPAQPGSPAEELSSLPGAEAEARSIATLLKASLLTGDRATRQTVMQLMPQASLIHLATHGLLDLDANLNEFGELTAKPVKTARQSGVFIGPGVIFGDNVTIGGVPASIAAAREGVRRVEMPGAIALAPTPRDPGFLTAKEIATLKLQANLVVLSACDTGRGRITGDGVVGLSRAFMAAGVPSVVVSLWAVPDAPTASLMTEFYQALQTNPNKAQALRKAMLITAKQYPNPRDWAAFTLVGEP